MGPENAEIGKQKTHHDGRYDGWLGLWRGRSGNRRERSGSRMEVEKRERYEERSRAWEKSWTSGEWRRSRSRDWVRGEATWDRSWYEGETSRNKRSLDRDERHLNWNRSRSSFGGDTLREKSLSSSQMSSNRSKM